MRGLIDTLENRKAFALIIAFAVVSFWRGVWGLMDLYLFPSNLTISYIASTLLGIFILSSTHYMRREFNIMDSKKGVL